MLEHSSGRDEGEREGKTCKHRVGGMLLDGHRRRNDDFCLPTAPVQLPNFQPIDAYIHVVVKCDHGL